MSAIAPMTLADGAATPVNHTFSPVFIDKDGIATYADRSGGIPVGFPIVTISQKVPGRGANGSKNYRSIVKVTVPVLEVTSPSTGTGIQPAPTVAYNMIFNGEFVMPERATQQNRKDLLAYAKNLIGNAVLTAAVTDLEQVY